jgi:hypothetical protein
MEAEAADKQAEVAGLVAAVQAIVAPPAVRVLLARDMQAVAGIQVLHMQAAVAAAPVVLVLIIAVQALE